MRRIQQNLKPFTCNGDISIGVKNSQVEHEIRTNKQNIDEKSYSGLRKEIHKYALTLCYYYA